MKKTFALLLLCSTLLACNDTDGDGNKDINIHIDLDSTGDKLKKGMDKLGDSAAAKAKRLEKKIDEKMDTIHQ